MHPYYNLVAMILQILQLWDACKKAPRVPICTYRWEDLRRAKKKGGYPWTYLYKPPFLDNLDPEPFTMDALRRSKSSSTVGNQENTVEITEIATESRKNSFNPMVTEPEDHSIPEKTPPSSSVLIIECPTEVENKDTLGSDESSDNISQYLDKDETNIEEVKVVEEKRDERAKSEDPQTRKRKLSAESSYSRLSLSKLAVMKKIRDAKKKMKVPKISLHTSKFKKPAIPKKHSLTEIKKEPARSSRSLVTDNPQYIHIPLKPPPGETDEFSYLEFGDKKPEEKKKEIKINPAFKGLLKSVRELGEKEKEKEKEKTQETEKEIPMEISNEAADNQTPAEAKEEIVEKMEIEETKETKEAKEDIKLEETTHEDEKPSKADNIPEEKKEQEEKTGESTEEEDVFERFFKKPEPPVVEQLPKPSDSRQARSKSAEPERKRKGSLESSYSRKSLSKLAFIKRLKEASDRVKSTLTRSGSSKKEQKKKPQQKLKEFVSAPVEKKVPQNVKPVYIHIPLKPPEGQTDEFSYLEFEGKRSEPEEPQPESSPEVPSPTAGPGGVQLIFLTPPSDDEILDDKLDIPDTPQSETTQFFGGKIDELKALAQQAVDQVSPETKKHTLDSVKEESSTGSNEEIKIEKEDTKMTVDVEDGLNEPPKVEKPLKKKVSFRKKSTKPTDDGEYEPIEAPKDEKSPPVVVQETPVIIEEKPKAPVLQTSVSLTAEEEKTYLDKKIMKETSLEEDYNKWSKLSDHDNHEYEPVNPPEEVTFVTAPTVTVIDTEKFKDFVEAESSNRVLPSTTELKNSELKLERRIERAEPRTSAQSSNVSDTSKKSEPDKTTGSDEPMESVKTSEGSSKFQTALKQKTSQLKTKLSNIKKPHINLPKRPSFRKPVIHKPDFKKFKFEKPNIQLPKIRTPSFSKSGSSRSSKRTPKERNTSTESTVGDSNESRKPIFDYTTIPRWFHRKEKGEKKSTDVPSYATSPRNKSKVEDTSTQSRWSGTDSIRIPLHSEDSVELNLEEQTFDDDEIDTDDAYTRENDEINKAEAERRWQRGSFKSKDEPFKTNRQVTDLDSPEEPPVSSDRSNDVGSVDNIGKRYASDDFGPKPGVMEEIGSDEFVIRQKGISQENIEYRKYLTSEIREAFRTPTSALSQTQTNGAYRDYPSGSIQSLPDTPSKKKGIKKPKRKKTPHHSQEQIPYDEESVDEFTSHPPSRPKRRSKRLRKPKVDENVVPYQETIPLDDRLAFARESLGILGDDEREEIEMMYENEKMQGKDQPDIMVSDPYDRFQPEAPPRKHRSLKSLNFSENDSILGFSSIGPDREYPQPSVPTRPLRTRSRTSSLGSRSEFTEAPKRPQRTRSKTSLSSTPYIDDIVPQRPQRTKSKTSLNDIHQYIIPVASEQPQRPARQRSRTSDRDRESIDDIDSYLDKTPCVEEPCVQDIRDSMGYAIVDKSKVSRDPPLPPPRTPPRRRRSFRSSKSATPSDMKFSTVPRSFHEAPVRPLRNYSTLAQMSSSKEEPRYENKENIDITQYIEVDDPCRDLQSGDVIQKMRERPLPAPPRPPRKHKQFLRKSLQDITSRENIMRDSMLESPTEKELIFEEHVSTQTEPLPDDFVCEELIQEPTDTIITPRVKRSAIEERESSPLVKVERHLITPTSYTHEETVTHASLIVEPLEGAKILPESQLTKSNERIIPVSREESDEETSVIPEDFKKLKSAPQDIEVLKTQKLHVSDLDVDRLSVSQLLANRIVVSEIDSSNIQTTEISSKSGPLRVGEIELPPSFVQEIIRNIRSEVQAQNEESAQKKTPMKHDPSPPEGSIEYLEEERSDLSPVQAEIEPEPPVPPPRTAESLLATRSPPGARESSEGKEEVTIDGLGLDDESPKRPPRQAKKEEELSPSEEARLEPEVDDEPPPRPPAPAHQPPHPDDYLPSQPPLSFYALRAQKYVDENIPAAPRRRRHAKSRRSRSTSPESSGATPRRPPRRLSEPSIPRLAGQLFRACGTQADAALRRLIKHVTENVLRNQDGTQDAQVMIVILLVLVAGLVLLGYGDGKTVVHHHHWEYFNPPRDM